MQYKDILTPYIVKLYKNEYDKNFLIESKSKHKIDNFENCGSNIWLDDEGHITGANFCKQRLCPVCNYRRSTMMWHKINEIVQQFEKNEFVFITLTVRNCKGEELSSTIDHLLNSFKRITNRKTWKKCFIGYVRGLEITYNPRENTFHPHIHILVATSEKYFKEHYVDIHYLQKWWMESANLDYYAQVDIRKVKNKEKAVAEVAKYAVKMSDILENGISSQRLRATQILGSCLSGRRLISTGGEITKKARQLKINLDDDYDGFSARETSTFYQWQNGKYEIQKS
jgi:plasmid rolling circle replication initiator protein Rep